MKLLIIVLFILCNVISSCSYHVFQMSLLDAFTFLYEKFFLLVQMFHLFIISNFT